LKRGLGDDSYICVVEFSKSVLSLNFPWNWSLKSIKVIIFNILNQLNLLTNASQDYKPPLNKLVEAGQSTRLLIGSWFFEQVKRYPRELNRG
jgi:hypothetical protein